MSVESAPFYWIACDDPGCDARCIGNFVGCAACGFVLRAIVDFYAGAALESLTWEQMHTADHYLATKYGVRCPGCGDFPSAPSQETER